MYFDKILSVNQIKQADAETVKEENISSFDLMERAANGCVSWIKEGLKNIKSIGIVCGTGNNGGDGLAIARLLSENIEIKIEVFILHFSKNKTPDFLKNFELLKRCERVIIHEIFTTQPFLLNTKFDILIDSIIGSGLSSSAQGWLKETIEYINKLLIPIVSIDIPSGLFADKLPGNDLTAIQATYTLSFQFPKFSFLFQETEKYVGTFIVLPIRLSKEYIENVETTNFYITKNILKILRSRSRFSHKGTFGHSLIVAGSYGKIGAAVLSAKACLRSGTGLVTVHIPKKGVDIVQTSFPEAMVSIDTSEEDITSAPANLATYQAIGVGPGIGTSVSTKKMLLELLQAYNKPLVIDADAINILAEEKGNLKLIPQNSILTPHVKEFERLTKKVVCSQDRLNIAKEFAVNNKLYLILKGANTAICTPNGNVYFNSTGNPRMATAGSGDVLTGIITSFLAQGYSSLEAALLGVYIHGLAGDIAAQKNGQMALIASDIIDSLRMIK